jgi:hypothetical protein
MTVYVDTARIPATVAGIRGRWSHLTADTPEELHDFADRIGLQRGWYQVCRSRCGRLGAACVHWHYDVTESKRVEAIAAGAQVIGLRELSQILAARRAEGASR